MRVQERSIPSPIMVTPPAPAEYGLSNI
jgi:hypothetical protein